MCHLVFVDHFIFLHFLDGYDLTSLAVTTDPDFTESTTADNFERLEVSHGDTGTAKSCKNDMAGG